MSDYLNLTGPPMSGLGMAYSGEAKAPPAAAPVANAAPAAEVPTHSDPGQQACMQGNIAGLLGNSLDVLNGSGVPLSRDVLALGAPAAAAPVVAQAEVLGNWEAKVDLSPEQMGAIDLSGPVAVRQELDNPVIRGDRQAYAQAYEGVSDVLDLKPESVSAVLEGNPQVAETRRLDQLVTLMSKGVDIGQVAQPSVSGLEPVVSASDVDQVSESNYENVGKLGLQDDPSASLSDFMKGSAS